ncbi:hypothetical protein [Streptomyces buecherae]|uniref:hypothetical protein n=1 Tax=Streptomyces buecherae TaxID=2763006 RepID=UPI0037AD85F5
MAMRPHVLPTPPGISEAELDLTRWEDDGGLVHEPRPAPQAAEWLRIAAALTDRLPELADREDVLVTCEEQTRSGAPAAFFPTEAALEIDRALFGPLRPSSIDPAWVGDEANYPVAWGAFTHEAAHAAHSRWHVPTPLCGTAVHAAAHMLEESRAERAHLSRRPADQGFLRAAIQALVMKDFVSETPSDPWHAALAAALILARRDAGVLEVDEARPVEQLVSGVLGHDLLDTLATIWTAVHGTADEDHEAMMQHAEAWCRALGVDPAGPEPTPDKTAGGLGELTRAVGKAVAAVAAKAESAPGTGAMPRPRTQPNAGRAARAREAAGIAKKVFAPGGTPYAPEGRTGPNGSPVTGTCPPTGAEKAAASRLARELRAAATRQRITTVTFSAVPPGRLNMRQAIARDAQRAAGVPETATPWARTVHRPGPTPSLRVGIAVDVSGSMNTAAKPMASAAWIVAKAAALTDPASGTATVAYDHSVTAIIPPGRPPRHVTEFTARGFGHSLAESIDSLSASLDLLTPGAGRLLVIASDGRYRVTEAARATERLAALRMAGCAVLWLAFAPHPRPLPGATLLELAEPAGAATAIGKAAVAALAATGT